MYLNLDLLYNTYNYLFPLFYYFSEYDCECCDWYLDIYSPIFKKFIIINGNTVYYNDYNDYILSIRNSNLKFTEKECTSGFPEYDIYTAKRITKLPKCILHLKKNLNTHLNFLRNDSRKKSPFLKFE